MVKRGSELASICRYQGIVSVKKRKFMRDSNLDTGQCKVKRYFERDSEVADDRAGDPHGSVNVFEAF